MVATMFRREQRLWERTRPHPTSRSWGGAANGNPDTEPDAARAQAATNGSPLPRVLFPGPSSFRAGKQDAAHQPQPKAIDVTRSAERGGSVARPRNHRNGTGERCPTKETASIACELSAQSEKEGFQETKTARRMPCNPNRPNGPKELTRGNG
jgi:hypothetical protein